MNYLIKKKLYYYRYLNTRNHLFSNENLGCEMDPQVCSDIICNYLTSDAPCMIARFGSIELANMVNYLSVRKGWFNIFRFLKGEVSEWWWNEKSVSALQTNAGFFPADISSVERFCELMLNEIKYIDVLASWRQEESQVMKYMQSLRSKIFLPYLEPYWASRPWSRFLEGKNVLVVHPFADLIKSQYEKKRELLFENPSVLPLFNLDVMPAIQSLGGGKNIGYDSWFDALEYMKGEIDKYQYDICILRCGAYGLPFAAHIKRQGKKAIHMGGATQLFFGIKGNRWENPMYGVKEWNLPEGYYLKMFNENWVKPGLDVKPEVASNVEGACYW